MVFRQPFWRANYGLVRPAIVAQNSSFRAFELDEPEIALPFSRRLARENAWTVGFASRVIEEYKRFIYLACVSDAPVTPSDEVDQAWHLHLAYTRSYWDELCETALRRKLHHGPTKGGKREGEKFDAWYERTKAFYATEFDTPPPIDIWPSSEERFSRPLHRKRIDTSEAWVIRKPGFLQLRVPLAVVSVAALVLLSGPHGWADGTYPGVDHKEVPASAYIVFLALMFGLPFVFFMLLAKAGADKKADSDGCGSHCGGGGSGCGGCGE